MNTRRVKKQAGSLIQNSLKAAAGFAVAKVITSKVGIIQSNPILGIAVPFVGAMFAGSVLPKGIAPAFAVGMAVAGAVNGVQQLAPTIANTIGLAGPLDVRYSGSLVMPGVAGYGDVVVE
jgi:hypothetical protein